MCWKTLPYYRCTSAVCVSVEFARFFLSFFSFGPSNRPSDIFLDHFLELCESLLCYLSWNKNVPTKNLKPSPVLVMPSMTRGWGVGSYKLHSQESVPGVHLLHGLIVTGRMRQWHFLGNTWEAKIALKLHSNIQCFWPYIIQRCFSRSHCAFLPDRRFII